MKYRVRSSDGELVYESLEDLRQAAELGLVGPEDELRGEEEPQWRKASTVAKLWKGRRSKRAFWSAPLLPWILLALSGGAFAFWAIHRGNVEQSPELYAAGLVVVFVVVGVLFKVTGDAQKRRR